MGIYMSVAAFGILIGKSAPQRDTHRNRNRTPESSYVTLFAEGSFLSGHPLCSFVRTLQRVRTLGQICPDGRTGFNKTQKNLLAGALAPADMYKWSMSNKRPT
ncbi:hypothetical protein BV22DRAFT_918847 [Leucogyrophana mollusca]|uniref:Uncharacterized protein n=1 Tax=Leucogyrophana mollusca TaxID=85980 RepID=A0ACB8AYI9_9AGAM|nr:hypothetical protein BV22DRAFT_918847 [Leucogyrophana mollusca]